MFFEGIYIIRILSLLQESNPHSYFSKLKDEYPLHARVVTLGGFSAHGDRNEMTRWLKESNIKIKRIAVVNGEEDQSLEFADHLIREKFNAFVPRAGETIPVN